MFLIFRESRTLTLFPRLQLVYTVHRITQYPGHKSTDNSPMSGASVAQPMRHRSRPETLALGRCDQAVVTTEYCVLAKRRESSPRVASHTIARGKQGLSDTEHSVTPDDLRLPLAHVDQ